LKEKTVILKHIGKVTVPAGTENKNGLYIET